MKFVKVQKVKLVATTYTEDTLKAIEDLSFAEIMQNWKAPEKVVLSNIWFLSELQFQILAMWLCRGSVIRFAPKEVNTVKLDENWNRRTFTEVIRGAVLQPTETHQEWAYSFVDSIPQYYIDRQAFTTQQAYDLGNTLIQKAQKASKIPFDLLEKAYKRLMKACLTTRVYATSPNEKTFFEASSELSTDKDLEELHSISDEAEQASTTLTDAEISFYARAFGIELPIYYIRYTNKATKHGFAIMPYLTTNPYAGMMTDGFISGDTSAFKDSSPTPDKRMYANNLDDTGDIRIAPLTLQKDGLPKRIDIAADRARLAEQITFFLSLELKEQINLLSPEFGYCGRCKEFYERASGCTCGHRKPQDVEECNIISQAYKLYASRH